MKEPDTSPRWDRRSWQIDAARRALRTAARDGIPGRDDAEPSRRCRKKGLYTLFDGQLGMGQVLSSIQLFTHELCQHYKHANRAGLFPADIKNPPPGAVGGGPVGLPSRRFALEI